MMLLHKDSNFSEAIVEWPKGVSSSEILKSCNMNKYWAVLFSKPISGVDTIIIHILHSK